MLLRTLASLLAVLAVSIAPVAAARCPQDCLAQTPIEGFGSWPITQVCGGYSAGPICVGYPAIAFRWTAPWGGSFRAMTCGGDGTDTTLGVFTPCGPGGAYLGCQDDSCALESDVWFTAQAAADIRIEVGVFFPSDCINAGRLTIQPFPVAGTAFCSGDGSATACPCGNSGAASRGCRNSAQATGAILVGSGQARVSADTLMLSSSGLPDGTALFFQGDARVANGAGVLFGDGLRCVGGGQVRLAISSVANHVVRHPLPGGTPISIAGGVAAGNVRHYQVWYRDAASYCTAATFNLTNGWTITWAQ